MTDDVAFMPATRLLALYRNRQLSPVEVIDQTLRRLETYESAINAFVLYDPEIALSMARASEARWHKGEPQGLLEVGPGGPELPQPELGLAAAEVDAKVPGAEGRLAQAEARHGELLARRERRRQRQS